MNGWCYVSIFIVLLLLHCVGDEHLGPHWMSKLRKHFCFSALLTSDPLTFDSFSISLSRSGWMAGTEHLFFYLNNVSVSKPTSVRQYLSPPETRKLLLLSTDIVQSDA